MLTRTWRRWRGRCSLSTILVPGRCQWGPRTRPRLCVNSPRSLSPAGLRVQRAADAASELESAPGAIDWRAADGIRGAFASGELDRAGRSLGTGSQTDIGVLLAISPISLKVYEAIIKLGFAERTWSLTAAACPLGLGQPHLRRGLGELPLDCSLLRLARHPSFQPNLPPNGPLLSPKGLHHPHHEQLPAAPR